MSSHQGVIDRVMPCSVTEDSVIDGKAEKRFVPGVVAYHATARFSVVGVPLSVGEPATITIGPEPETVELGVATVNDVNQFWLDGECLGFREDLAPGEYRITATRVG